MTRFVILVRFPISPPPLVSVSAVALIHRQLNGI